MLILGIIVAGLLVGWFAQLILGRRGRDIDWLMALVAGISGSFVGGLVLSLLFDDGLSLQPSGIIGSVLGALIVTVVWTALKANRSRRRG
jgi:uncharacterized membrane protein YeaQ/YmgE (transglycosylase-associated protein family)